MNLDRQIELCTNLRDISIKSLVETIKQLRIGESTEYDAVTILKNELIKRKIESYWYPSGEEAGRNQFGIIAAFDSNQDKQRTAFSNARKLIASDKVNWDGLGYFYMSPQILNFPDGEIIWGDFASSIYLGDSETVQSYFKKSWQLSVELINKITSNTTTKQLIKYYDELYTANNIKNIAVSLTGPKMGSNKYNIGHSFPRFSGIRKEEIHNSELMNRIRNARIFIDSSSDSLLSDNIWSLESRDKPYKYPYGMISFHHLIGVTDKNIYILPNHKDLFEKIGMNWIME